MLFSAPDKVIIVFLVYGDKHAQSGIEQLTAIVTRMLPGCAVELVVVDNALSCKRLHRKNGVLTIGGDNSLWEFSGWDHGIDFVKKNFSMSSKTMILFANDTFHRRIYKNSKNFLDVFDKPILIGENIIESAIGYLDDFPKDVSLCGMKYRSWIRSNIFFLPISVVDKIYPISKTVDPMQVFSADYKKFWSDSSLISDNWKAYISSWLFGIENSMYPEYSLHWLKACPVSPKNHDFFKKKSLCILAEHYLTARLFDMGVPIINTNIFEKKNDRHTSAYYD